MCSFAWCMMGSGFSVQLVECPNKNERQLNNQNSIAVMQLFKTELIII